MSGCKIKYFVYWSRTKFYSGALLWAILRKAVKSSKLSSLQNYIIVSLFSCIKSNQTNFYLGWLWVNSWQTNYRCLQCTNSIQHLSWLFARPYLKSVPIMFQNHSVCTSEANATCSCRRTTMRGMSTLWVLFLWPELSKLSGTATWSEHEHLTNILRSPPVDSTNPTKPRDTRTRGEFWRHTNLDPCVLNGSFLW